MAVKIPIYEDRLTPNGFGVVPRAANVEISDSMGRAMQNLGNAGNEVAFTEMRVQKYEADQAKIANEKLQKKIDDDAITAAGKTISDAALHWDGYLKKSSETQGMNYDGFMPKTVKEFDDYTNQTLAGITNPKAKQWAEQHFNSLRTNLGQRAITMEAQAGVAARDDNVETTYQNLARIAAKDPSQYEFGRQILLSTIANAGYDPQTRVARAKSYLERYGEQALTGEIERNPTPVKSTLERTYTGSFGSAVNFVLGQEGGYVANDAGKGPTNFGINSTANPGVDVKNLTKDGAKEIYKSKYWDAIGGDQLNEQNPALALVALDTAVNMGAPTAKKLLAEAGGDVNKLMQLREQRYAEIIKNDPSKAQYKDVWAKRMSDLRSEVDATSGPAAPVISKIAGDINVDRLPTFINSANTEANRQMGVYRSQLQTREGDDIAKAMNGILPQNPITQAEYLRYYPADGDQRYANYQSIMTMGADINALKLQTPEQMMATADRYKPNPENPGYEAAVKRYETVLKAVDQVNQARQADPMAFAMATKSGDAKPLSFEDRAAFGAELNKRQGVAANMQQTYGAPYSLLTKAEAATLNQGFQRMTTDEKRGYLNAIKSSVTDPVAFRSIMQQVAPDSPVTSVAGAILMKQNALVDTKISPMAAVSSAVSSVLPINWQVARRDAVYAQQDVAGLLLEGEALLNPNKSARAENGKGKEFPMPEEKEMREKFANIVGNAFAADPNGANYAFQAVKAYYAGKSAREGDLKGKLDDARLEEAVFAATGGVYDLNSKGSVLVPWGMSVPRFKNEIKAAYDNAMEANGYKGTTIDNYDQAGLQSYGDSKYVIRSGNGYMLDKSGKAIVLDLTEKPSMQNLIPGGAPAPQLAQPATQVQGKTTKPNTQQPKTK